SEADVDRAIEEIAGALKGLPDVQGGRLVGYGGTVKMMAAVAQRHEQIGGPLEGFPLKRDEIDRQILHYEKKTVAERRKIDGMEADRADIILAGALIVRACLQHAGIETITVS